MSRSWERKVRKNMSTINKQRKKHGHGQMVLGAEKADKFVGRNYVIPVLLLLFVAVYNVFMQVDPAFNRDTIYWITVMCYIALAALFFFRRPYLKVGKDYVQSRRFSGDKRLKAADIEAIRVQDGYAMIIPKKGAGWTFSRLLNRFQTDAMAERLRAFATAHGVKFEQK